jgi:hypothetical protein
MRGTLSLPAMRDPEVLERLNPNHVLNMCTRLQVISPPKFLCNRMQISFAVSLQLVRHQNRARSKRDQHEDQRGRSRHRQTLGEDDRASKAVCCLRRGFLTSSTDLPAVESMQHAAESEHRADGVAEQQTRRG